MQPTISRQGHYPRDHSRTERAKSVAQARKRARRDKSTLLFLCWAFPAETTH